MIKKHYLKSRPACKLTFELPADFEADELQLLADFNHWKGVSFKRLKDGKWKLIQEVAAGKAYEFRYRAIKNTETFYFNDDHADRYNANIYGSNNAVIDI